MRPLKSEEVPSMQCLFTIVTIWGTIKILWRGGILSCGAHKFVVAMYILTDFLCLPQQKSTSWNHDSIYMAPGTDECTLYSQLEEIVVDNVTRSTLQ